MVCVIYETRTRGKLEMIETAVVVDLIALATCIKLIMSIVRWIKMSMYRCFECENIYDADYDECEGHPANDCELVCLDCYNKLTEEVEKNDA